MSLENRMRLRNLTIEELIQELRRASQDGGKYAELMGITANRLAGMSLGSEDFIMLDEVNTRVNRIDPGPVRLL